MKIRYCSDLHLEFDKHIWAVPVQPDDHATVLVLAGDIWNGTRPVSYSGGSWLGELSKRFYHVVLVLGNHDYYRENVDRLPTKFRALIEEQGLSNVHLLEISEGIELGKVLIDGIAFVGGTLWTSMGNGNPTVSTDFDILRSGDRYTWNDRNHIRSGTQYHRFSSSDWIRIHQKSINNLCSVLEETCSPTVLVSHHAPFMARLFSISAIALWAMWATSRALTAI